MNHPKSLWAPMLGLWVVQLPTTARALNVWILENLNGTLAALLG